MNSEHATFFFQGEETPCYHVRRIFFANPPFFPRRKQGMPGTEIAKVNVCKRKNRTMYNMKYAFEINCHQRQIDFQALGSISIRIEPTGMLS